MCLNYRMMMFCSSPVSLGYCYWLHSQTQSISTDLCHEARQRPLHRHSLWSGQQKGSPKCHFLMPQMAFVMYSTQVCISLMATWMGDITKKKNPWDQLSCPLLNSIMWPCKLQQDNDCLHIARICRDILEQEGLLSSTGHCITRHVTYQAHMEFCSLACLPAGSSSPARPSTSSGSAGGMGQYLPGLKLKNPVLSMRRWWSLWTWTIDSIVFFLS